MTHLRAVETIAEMRAREAREQLLRVLNNLGLTEGQRKRLTTLIGVYGTAQFQAGQDRGERLPKDAA